MRAPSFRFELSTAGASARGGWAPGNDDRWLADLERGLLLVADASGPTYGGYHAPLGIEPGLAALLRGFDRATGDGERRLLEAFGAAHEEMRRIGQVPPRPFTHCYASVTACCLWGEDQLSIVQVGGCRAYRCRGGRAELLARDQTLPSMFAAQGQEVDQGLLQAHRTTVLHLLGSGELSAESGTRPVQPGDTYVLCSDAVWADPELEELLMHFSEGVTEAEVQRAVSSCAARARGDATALVLSISL
jgi:serine/threonine protein phosphatase PrpC